MERLQHRLDVVRPRRERLELETHQRELGVRAQPDALYELVADVTRTPEFSPEIVDCRWLDGATGPVVGARFKARNKMPNRPTFSNKPVVTVAEPGRTFAFARTESFGGTVEWRYEFVPDGDLTTVTESYTVTKPVSRSVGSSSGRCSAVRTVRPISVVGWSRRSTASRKARS